MDSVGVWGEAWLTCNQGNPVLHLTAVSFGGGGRRIVSPILTSSHFTDGKTGSGAAITSQTHFSPLSPIPGGGGGGKRVGGG